MRLHSLRLQAFGPFARRHTVDFDALSADGLFLLHGDTGADKSTLFAAICFAPYGLPPHERNTRLRSDHAPADLPTEVTLEVTLAGKRLQIRRIPAQKRPHLRNSAELVDQKAETCLHQWVLDEHGHGQWEGIIKSHKEAGEEIKSLLRLTRPQFPQVVLLPQNEFTTFLRADASERRILLRTLFGTRRFGLIEEFLATRKPSPPRRATRPVPTSCAWPNASSRQPATTSNPPNPPVPTAPPPSAHPPAPGPAPCTARPSPSKTPQPPPHRDRRAAAGARPHRRTGRPRPTPSPADGFDHFLRQRLLTSLDDSIRSTASRTVTSFEGTC
ncbi:AAA family ATPase [Streptomyces sp. NPDC059015]|uniref:AAA family ATPase n=1 Tax=unclassified Streptomyces TaxID=2593676 RepID=UPI003692FBEA